MAGFFLEVNEMFGGEHTLILSLTFFLLWKPLIITKDRNTFGI
jgi:hypothetical protein